MKVLMFGWEFPPHILGGLGTASYGLTKGLAAQGDVDITFVIPKPWGDEDQSFLKIIGANHVPVVWRDVEWGFVNERVGSYMSPEEYYRLRDGIRYDFRRIGTDELGCINFSGRYPDNLMEEISNYEAVASVLAHSLQYDVNPEVYRIEKEGMDAADRIITVSNLTRATVIERYHQNPDKVITVHNAVEPLDFLDEIEVKPHKDKVVTFLGRITMQKGPEYFVEVAAKVLEKTRKVRFVMAGSGDMMNQMVTLVAQKGIADRFHFTGFLKGRQVYEMLAVSDVYMMPSVSEPFGISPLEAMQCGTPCVISKQSGCAEILDHAIKADYWDIDAMADYIHAIVEYPAMYKTLRENGLKEIAGIRWDVAGRKVRGIYDSLLR